MLTIMGFAAGRTARVEWFTAFVVLPAAPVMLSNFKTSIKTDVPTEEKYTLLFHHSFSDRIRNFVQVEHLSSRCTFCIQCNRSKRVHMRAYLLSAISSAP